MHAVCTVCICNFLKISTEERDEKSSKLACAEYKMDESTVGITDYYKVELFYECFR